MMKESKSKTGRLNDEYGSTGSQDSKKNLDKY